MADIDQAVSAVKGTTGPVTQRWKEFLTGAYARLTGSLLYAMSSGSSGEFSVRASTAGNLHVELQPSTEVVGLLGASTAMVGHAILDASTARIGSLYPSTEIIGYTIPAGSTWITLLASSARTTSPVSSDQADIGYQTHILQMVYQTSTGASITPTLEIKDPINNVYRTIWTAASAISSTGHYAYLFDLGGIGSAGDYTEATNIRLGYQWRLNVTHSSSGATTYTAAIDLLV